VRRGSAGQELFVASHPLPKSAMGGTTDRNYGSQKQLDVVKEEGLTA